MNIQLRWTLAILILGCFLVLGSQHLASAQTEEDGATLAGVWPLSVEALADGHLDGLRASSQGLALTPGSTSGQWTSTPLEAEWEFIALGATWEDPLPEGVTLHLEVRTSPSSAPEAWSPWSELHVEAEHSPDQPGRPGSDLLFARGNLAQLRATITAATPGAALPAVLSGLQLVYLDSRPGPTADEASAQPLAPTVAGDPTIISRAGWGADESLRYSNGQEIWPPEYSQAQLFFVHHTAGSNYVPDGAAAVRSVYYFHAVTRGWGDIGYHFVIDPQGRVYEGRAGGQQGSNIVIGGHTYGLNNGSMGVSTLGDFTSTPYPAAAETSLVRLLAARGNAYSIHPLQPRSFGGYSWPAGIMGHRDGGARTGSATTCPGDQLYARLPSIRQRAWETLLGLDPWLWMSQVPSPLPGQQSFNVAASIATTQIDLYVDGFYWGTDPTSPFSIVLTPNGLSNGSHRATIVARTAAGRTATIERPFTVANQATTTPTRTPSPTWTASPTRTPTRTATATLSPSATPSPSVTATPSQTPTPSVTATPSQTPSPSATPGPMTARVHLPLLWQGGAGTQPPTETPSPTPTTHPPSPTPTGVPACPQVLNNSGMESEGGWLPSPNTDILPEYSALEARSGNRSLLVGPTRGMVPTSVQWSSARQSVAIPLESQQAELSFWYWTEAEGNAGNDTQYILLLDAGSGAVVRSLVNTLENNRGWQQATFDLSALAGRSLLVYAGVKNDGSGGATRLFIDDVMLMICE